MGKMLSAIARGTLAAKFAAMAVIGVVCMVLIAVAVLCIARSELLAARVEKAHAVVDGVWGMAEYFQHAAETGAMTDTEARARFKVAAGAVSFEHHNNYLYIYDTETGLCVVNTGNPAFVGKDMRGVKDANGLPFAAMMIDIAKTAGEGTVRYVFARAGVTPLDKIAYVRAFTPWHLMLGTAVFMTDINDTFWAMTRAAGMVIGGLMVISIGITWLIGRGILKPLTRLKARMAGLSAGELDDPVAGSERRDELGEMARSVVVFKDHMISEHKVAAELENSADAGGSGEAHGSGWDGRHDRGGDGYEIAGNRCPHRGDRGNGGCHERIGLAYWNVSWCRCLRRGERPGKCADGGERGRGTGGLNS